MPTSSTVTIKVADVEPVTAILAKAGEVVDASATLLVALGEEGTWPREAALLRDKMGEFRTMMSRLNGN